MHARLLPQESASRLLSQVRKLGTDLDVISNINHADSLVRYQTWRGLAVECRELRAATASLIFAHLDSTPNLTSIVVLEILAKLMLMCDSSGESAAAVKLTKSRCSR